MLILKSEYFNTKESMYITTLEQMESIVSANKDLHWDGWTVVERIPNKKGMTSKFGAFANGKWYMQKRFEPNEKGWKLPSKYLGKENER